MTLTAEARVIDDPAVRETVFAHLSRAWGVRITGYKPNFLGLHNRKWIVHTDAGDLFVKCYHPKRYSLLDPKRLEKIERSLMVQQYLHENGVPCPAVKTGADGRPVYRTPDGHFYVVMHCAAGRTAKAGTVDPLRMYRLGQVTGLMHRLLARSSPQTGAVEGWKPSLPVMNEEWRSNLKAAQQLPNLDARLLAAMEEHGRILSTIDLSIFDGLKHGWAHWDYWVDNILFDEDQVSGLIDFDTVTYGYPEIDVARVLLSAAFDAEEGELRTYAAEAFLDGYREHRIFPYNRLPLAFKLLWCREAHWWLRGTIKEKDEPPKRFAEEMIWLTAQWEYLESQYADW
ncbi:phosphotransferase enzyme family protein [Paenibacillus allorhizosphaerae]|uniref:Homoserine kinase n=1 Tax=Paenibacillus allorhizosphaerae TaxID=2849866 RepID=A0ABM8VJ83_9BACL|nr:phosphotransferase [Paenibacillus allorhizosphaerae]CAG7645127.1 Homoserine kinase [Paenibacillus allorhizosphaerae]